MSEHNNPDRALHYDSRAPWNDFGPDLDEYPVCDLCLRNEVERDGQLCDRCLVECAALGGDWDNESVAAFRRLNPDPSL